MKNKTCKILLVFLVNLMSICGVAQVISNGTINASITTQNPFLDASSFFDISVSPSSSGKGLVFPRTNLVSFVFKTNLLGYGTFPTAFDGMIVYNFGTGNTAIDQGVVSTYVTPGFYYFSNPNGINTSSVTGGKWVRMNDSNISSTPSGDAFPTDPAPKAGDVFYNTNDKKFYYYNGTAWVSATGTPAGNTAPVNPVLGDTWYDTNVSPYILKIWNGADWVLIGGKGTPTGSSAPTNPSVGDTWYDTSVSPGILKIYDGDTNGWVSVGGSSDPANGSIKDIKLQAAGGGSLPQGVIDQVLTSAGGGQFKWMNAGSLPSGTDLPVAVPSAGVSFYDREDHILYISDGSDWQKVSGGVSIPTDEPTSPSAGEVYYDTDDDNLYYYNGSDWVILNGVVTGATDPITGSVEGSTGDTYYDTNSHIYYVYDGDSWETIGGMVINDLITGGTTNALSAEQGKTLKGLVDGKLGSAAVFEGDVTGTYSATTVAKIQSVSVSTTTPGTGQVLKYNGTSWSPAADNSSTTTVTNDLITGGTTNALSAEQGKTLKGLVDGKLGSAAVFSGDVTGTYSATTVTKIQSVSVSTTTPGNGQVLKYNGTSWSPAADNSSTTTVTNDLITGGTTNALSAEQGKTLKGLVDGKLGSAAVLSGDVTGTYSATTVTKIQSVSVSTTTPGNGQVLKYNGTSWSPAADNSSTTTVTNDLITGGTTNALSAEQGKTLKGLVDGKLGSAAVLSGDVTGTYSATTVTKIQSVSVSTTTPGNGQVLKYNGTSWSPAADNSSTTTVTNDLITGGTTNALSAEQGKTLKGLVDGKLGSATVFEGDVTGTYSATTVAKIQSVSVSTTAPGTGQVLKYNGTSWSPATDNSSTTTVTNDLITGGTTNALSAEQGKTLKGLVDGKLGSAAVFSGDVTGTYSATTVAKIQSVSVSTTAPNNGQVLKYNGTSWSPAADNSSTTTVTNDLITGGTTNALSAEQGKTLKGLVDGKLGSAAVFSGDVTGTYSATTVTKIQSVSVSTTTPGNGQVLKYNGTSWSPAADNSSTTTVTNDLITGGTTNALSAEQGKTLKGLVDGKLGSAAVFSGDVTGTYSATTVTKIQSVSVSTTTPGNGQVLKYNGTSWSPAADNSSTTTVTNDLITGGTTNALSAEQGKTLKGLVDGKLGSATVFEGDVTGTATSTAIAAGVIVNDDVSGTAAIDGTKINPDFGAQTVKLGTATNTGTVGVIAFNDGSNTSTTLVNLKGPTNPIVTSYDIHLPAVAPADGQVLSMKTAATGETEWKTVSGGGGGFTSTTLGSTVTITQANNDVTFTGGKTIMGGIFQTKGALYAKPVRTFSTADVDIDWRADDVCVLLLTGYNQSIKLPSASANQNRLVAINNRSGAPRAIANTGGGDTGIYGDEGFSQLSTLVGMVWFVSDGTSWRLYSGRP